MKKVLIDTNIYSKAMRGEGEVVSVLKGLSSIVYRLFCYLYRRASVVESGKGRIARSWINF